MKQLIAKITEIPFLYNSIRYIVNGGTFKSKIKSLISVKEDDKILDICCGIGYYSSMFKGEYVGVDNDKKHIDYAIKKYGSTQKKFICQDIKTINFPENNFNKAFMINAVHHFSDEDNIKIFKKVQSLISDEFIIVDADLSSSNFFQKMLLRYDQGTYLRSLEEHKKLVSQVFDVEETFNFKSRTKSVALCIIRCKSKR
jgi:cyclopropane fatty-acyl-phospholipid synthase-like methyltransferase